MAKKALFLRWVLFIALIFVGAILASNVSVHEGLNPFNYIYASDVTKLSIVIFGIFIVMSIRCGILTWRANSDIETYNDYNAEIKDIENKADNGWFAAGLCEKIGLTGTVLGLIYMLINGFADFQVADGQAVKGLIMGMSTAFITTLVGIVCSMLLSIQYQNLSNAIDRLRSYYEKE